MKLLCTVVGEYAKITTMPIAVVDRSSSIRHEYTYWGEIESEGGWMAILLFTKGR